MVRKKDILMLAEKHNDCAFHIFTNGTLIDEELCKEVQRLGNLSFALSVEGYAETNDDRRGQGVFEKVMHAMDHQEPHLHYPRNTVGSFFLQFYVQGSSV